MMRKSHIPWLGLLLFSVMMLLVPPVTAQTPPSLFPLADPGPYAVGIRLIPLTDVDRANRNIMTTIWYPALQPDAPDAQQRILGDPETVGWLRALPDLQEAPYPVILYSHELGGSPMDRRDSALLLASHGYVVIAPQHPGETFESTSQTNMVERPLDVLFTLDQFATMTTGDLAGLMDSNTVGMIGDSMGAHTTLVMTGARIDPAGAAALAVDPRDPFDPTDPRFFFPDWNWERLATYRAPQSLPLVSDAGSSLSDPRIQAAVLNSPCWASMFGEAGLSSATVPTLVIGGTSDITCDYQENFVYTFDHLGSADRYLLSFIHGAHMPGMADVPGLTGPSAPAANQLLVAFFNTYLKGEQDDAQYLTTAYVESVEVQLNVGLVWGPYSDE